MNCTPNTGLKLEQVTKLILFYNDGDMSFVNQSYSFQIYGNKKGPCFILKGTLLYQNHFNGVVSYVDHLGSEKIIRNNKRITICEEGDKFSWDNCIISYDEGDYYHGRLENGLRADTKDSIYIC